MLHRLLSVSRLAFAVGAAARSAAPALQPVQSVEGITEYRLANGLQVLLVPDDSKPTTTVNLTYRVGSRHENYGETGMAHLLEHLMFKGSPKHPDGLGRVHASAACAANGTTSFDRTNYFASFAANDDNLKWYLDWQADAMVNSFIARKDLDSEMTVVRNEMETRRERPAAHPRCSARMAGRCSSGTTTARTTIGARSDVENVDIPRLQAFYRTYYQPDNATLVVSGKFDPAQVLRLGAGLVRPASRRPKRKLPTLYTLDPVQDGERSFTLRRSGGVPLLLAGYHAPAARRIRTSPPSTCWPTDPRRRAVGPAVQAARARSSWPPVRRRRPSGLADPGVMLFGAQLAPGQDVATAREGAARDARVAGQRADHAPRNWSAPRPSGSTGWERRFTNPEAVGVALSEAVGAGRLAPVLPAARPRARASSWPTCSASRPQYLMPPTACSAPTCRPSSRCARRRRSASTWRRRCKGYKRRRGGRAGRGLRRDAGQHRRAHPALRRWPAA